MTCQHTSTLGVYLLGALEPEERSTFESHLYGCDVCRAELVRLAPLPGLLNQIAVADFEETVELPPAVGEPARGTERAPVIELAPAAEPEPAPVLDLPEPAPEPALDLPEPVALAVREEEPDTLARTPSRKRYLQVAAAAAVVLVLAVGGIVGYQAMRGGGSGPQANSVKWSAIDPVTGVHADVQLTQKSWGTDIKVWMSDVPGSKECRLVVKARYGYRDKPEPYFEVAGWWTSDHKPGDDIPGSTSIDLDSIFQVEIMDGSTMLVGLHPTG